jgi:NhaA family Na+:H+ antiporter
MATDIAFALGMLSLAGDRVPFSLKIFLTALAIIDDLGAILVIAVFYSGDLSFTHLGISLGIFAALMVLNKTGVKNIWLYLVPGVFMWYFMLKSGVHATISGVLLAFALPFTKRDEDNPSYKFQRILHKPVAFFILPLFALANTGIILESAWQNELFSNNSLGIISGLVAGKPLGILLFSWIMVVSGFSALPSGVKWIHLLGAGMLGGIGFTMSIFISNLAFTDPFLIQYSKVAVLTASLLATVLGLFVLFNIKKTAVTTDPPEL